MEGLVQYFIGVKTAWSDYLSIDGIKRKFISTLVFLIIILILLPRFLQYVEARPGVVLDDPILKLFNPVNLTWITFTLIYASLILAVVHFLKHPGLLHSALLTYALMAAFRMAAMYTLPLDPPARMILLDDPFVQLFGSGGILTKDLFFSGHTSTLFVLYLITRRKTRKTVFLISTILVALCVLLQHVHYTIDVLAAPFFAFAAYKISSKLVSQRNS